MAESGFAPINSVLDNQPSRPSISLEHLPVEILDSLILEAAQFCLHSYDPSIRGGGTNSSWVQILRFKKGLPLICKTLYWSGMKALYNDIVFRRMEQIVVLARTLRLPDIGQKLCSAIHHMRMDSCTIMETCADVVRDDLAWILSNCTAIRSFAYHVHPRFPLLHHPMEYEEFRGHPGYIKLRGPFNPNWILHAEPRQALLFNCGSLHQLHRLELYLDLRLDGLPQGLHNVLQNSPALEALSLVHREVHLVKVDDATPSTVLRLPVLAELKVDLRAGLFLKEYICTFWKAPRLQRLTVLLAEDTAESEVHPFLVSFGARLVYVHIAPSLQPPAGTLNHELVRDLHTTCPAIEHLVLPYFSRYPFTLVVRSHTLRTLDVWFLQRRLHRPNAPLFADWSLGFGREVVIAPESDAPALCTVRALLAPLDVDTLRPQVRTPLDVPEVCAPDIFGGRLLAPGEYVVHRFPEQWYVQTARVVLPYDVEEMKDVVSIIAEERGLSPSEIQISPHSSRLDELSNWKFDREELLQIHATLKHCRNEREKRQLRHSDDDGSDPGTEDEDTDNEIEDMDAEDEIWTEDEDIEEEYLEWDGAEDESWAENPVVQLDRESVLAGFSRGLHEV